MRIGKRWLLVVLVAAGQLACLCVALAAFASWLQADLATTVGRQVLADNRQVAAQMATMIRAMGLRDVRPGSADWDRLQTAIEQVRLPNDGFVCVVRDGTGRILCHPKLRAEPALASIDLGAIAVADGGRTAPLAQSTGGIATLGDDVQVIGVSDVPDLGIKVLAHQAVAGVDAAAAAAVEPVRRAGTAAAVGLSLLTAAVTAGVVRRYENRLAAANENLERLVDARSRSLTRTRDAVIFGLAKLAESRDDDTGAHLDRIRDYVRVLADDLSAAGTPGLDDAGVRRLVDASSLHDIGKVGIPDAVLCKPGKLTPAERAVMQRHPTIGGDCLRAVEGVLGEDDFLTVARDVTLTHHERWDGTGYPRGLAGADIPLAGRVVAVADVYDALTSRRVYKPAMSHAAAARLIADGAGTQFDPSVVAAFARSAAAFADVALQHQSLPTSVVPLGLAA